MKKITKDSSLGEVMQNNPQIVAVLMGFGLHCLSCPASQVETIEQAAEVHGIDLDMLLEQLNEATEDDNE
jgi:hybrid cluster-associated redox disulfide protein